MVEFDPDIARSAMNACVDLTAHLLGAKGNLGRVTDVGDFAGPPKLFNSGQKWTEGYRALGHQMDGVLDTHVKIVASMAEAFRTAIREFAATENQNADDITSAKMPDTGKLFVENPVIADPTRDPTRQGVTGPKLAYQSKTGPGAEIGIGDAPIGRDEMPQDGAPAGTFTQGLHALFTYDGDFKAPSDDARVVSPENPYHKTWEDLQALHDSIDPKRAGNYAAQWGWLWGEIDKSVTAFGGVVNEAHFANGWSTGSGPTALKAAKDYIANAQALIAKLKDVESNLYKDAGWLNAAHDALPSGPMPKITAQTTQSKSGGSVTIYWVQQTTSLNPRGDYYHTEQAAKDAQTLPYQEKCESTYVAGIEAYNGSLVTYPKLDPPAPVVVDPNAGKQPDPNAGKQPALTNTGGSPTTPGTPATPTNVNPDNNNPTTPVTTDPNATKPNNTTTTKDDSLSTIVSAVEKVAEQGVSLVESLASTGATALQQGITSLSSLLTSQQTTKTTTTTDEQQQLKQQLEQEMAALTNGGGSPKDTGGGVPTSPGGTPTTTTPKVTESRLFPRSVVATNDDTKEEVVTASRAGLATTSTSASSSSTGSGMPMGAGGAQAAGQGGKEHKRPDYLKSGENLQDVFEGAPAAVLPVAEK